MCNVYVPSVVVTVRFGACESEDLPSEIGTILNKATCNTPGCLRHRWYECSHKIPILQTECGVPAYQTARPTPSKQDGARRVRDSEIGILHPVLSPRDPYVHVLYIHMYIYTSYLCPCDVPSLGFYPLHYLSLCIPIKEPALRAHAFFSALQYGEIHHKGQHGLLPAMQSKSVLGSFCGTPWPS